MSRDTLCTIIGPTSPAVSFWLRDEDCLDVARDIAAALRPGSGITLTPIVRGCELTMWKHVQPKRSKFPPPREWECFSCHHKMTRCEPGPCPECGYPLALATS